MSLSLPVIETLAAAALAATQLCALFTAALLATLDLGLAQLSDYLDRGAMLLDAALAVIDLALPAVVAVGSRLLPLVLALAVSILLALHLPSARPAPGQRALASAAVCNDPARAPRALPPSRLAQPAI